MFNDLLKSGEVRSWSHRLTDLWVTWQLTAPAVPFYATSTDWRLPWM